MLKRFQETDEIANLPWIQPELWHTRMARDDPFAKGFFERLDWISQMKRSEWRRNGQGARSDLVNGMATRTVRLRICLTRQDVGFGAAWNGNSQDSNDHSRLSHDSTRAHFAIS
jgi:hypothetical protein